ncbi:hypothetical protein QCE73_37270 [Caballeronia sp. LZ029]|uniref:hypothetical protein n=1 Tax=Caballeronia sp. LZ029 TaxID=3038564 RepID=UPI00285D6F7E|nr:hypothetical protein [Caballeronia sp. LZ029]MDR5748833.1 hypothetical protein [Caballeronia sp. LZ029]
MIQTIVDKLALSIASMATPAVSADRIGQVEPMSASQLPCLVVSVAVDDFRGTGLSRFARTGDVVTEQSLVLQVTPGANGFSDDLRSLRLSHLPLKKNPASVPGPFGAADLTVQNVTAAAPAPYSFVPQPAAVDQFSLDERTATLHFGASQPTGAKLQIVHWTMQWHDDIATTRVRGRLFVDVWDIDPVQLDSVSRKLTTGLFQGEAGLRTNGFARIALTGLEPISNLTQQPAHGSSFAAWRQRIGCAFIFDHETGGAVSEGVPIERIDVEPRGFEGESMLVR